MDMVKRILLCLMVFYVVLQWTANRKVPSATCVSNIGATTKVLHGDTLSSTSYYVSKSLALAQ